MAIIRCVWYFYLIQLVGLYLDYSNGFSTGPPTGFPGVCRTMIPSGHGPTLIPDDVPAPFTITMDATSYRPGEPLQVTLSSQLVFGVAVGSFKGFFLQARRINPDDGSIVQEPIGVFSQFPEGTSGYPCSRQDDITWGHSDNEVKRSVTATWTPPDDEEATVVFQATAVQGPLRSFYFTDLLSEEISFAGPSTPVVPSTAPPTTTPEAPTTTTPPTTPEAAATTTPPTTPEADATTTPPTTPEADATTTPTTPEAAATTAPTAPEPPVTTTPTTTPKASANTTSITTPEPPVSTITPTTPDRGAGSCSDRCNQINLDESASCQCNSFCRRRGDCCEDYADHCLTEVCTYVHVTLYNKGRKDVSP